MAENSADRQQGLSEVRKVASGCLSSLQANPIAITISARCNRRPFGFLTKWQLPGHFKKIQNRAGTSSSMSILEFPSRFALLVRSWKINHTSQAIMDALKIKKDVLSKYVSGDTKNLSNRASFANLAKALAAYLEEEKYLQRRGLTKEEFISFFSDPDDINFVQFISMQHDLPIPKSVRLAPRNSLNALAKHLTGHFLLYRLGIEKRREPAPDDARMTLERKVPVLRRIPFHVADPGANYLTYRDAYGWYGGDYEPAAASGFIFDTGAHLCVFAEDVNVRKQADLFMMQIIDQFIDRSDTDNPLREGVILMNGDGSMPAAAKIIVRKAPDQFQNLSWEKFAALAERKIILRDNDHDGLFDILAPDEDTEKIGDQPIGSKKYSWYANRLQIRSYKLHISFSDDQF
jgi:hypothetical protein